MKVMTILLLTATISTLLLANDAVAQQTNASSLIADTIAKYISASTGGSSYGSGQYPDAETNEEEEKEEQQSDGILTSLLTGPVINNFVQTVFNAVELKLNFLLTLRRILSYENIRACLLHLRKFLNLVLRLCTLINRFLPEAELDTSGLSALIGYYPSKLPQRPAKPAAEYGVPAKPAAEYGVPAKPASQYGVPAKPATEYGVPAKPTSEYGVPVKPAAEYGVPAKPASQYGVPAKPATEYGIPAKPTSEYGVPVKAAAEYRVPAKSLPEPAKSLDTGHIPVYFQASTTSQPDVSTQPLNVNSFPPNSPFDFKVSTEVPAEDDNNEEHSVYSLENVKALADRLNELKQSPEFSVPVSGYGVPHEAYGVPSVQLENERPFDNGYYYEY